MGSPRSVEVHAVATGEDVATWVSTYNLASPCRPEGVASTCHAWGLADERTALIAVHGGQPVGVAHVEVEVWTPASQQASATIIVPPGERGCGVGSALYAAVSEWGRARGRAGLEVWFDASSADAMGYWTRRGFAEVGRERLSHLDLAARPDPAVAPPAGVALVPLGEDGTLEEGMYRVGSDGIADIPGAEAYDAGEFAQWRDGELGWPGLMRDCSVVALAGGEVVGFATLVAFEARPGFAEHEMTTVARAWRCRGLATAMKAWQIGRARAAGLITLEAMNEVRNAAMLAVNDRLGYRPVTAWVQLRGPFAGVGRAGRPH